MSHEITGRLSWLVGWFGQWRVRAEALRDSSSDESDEASHGDSQWDDWFDELSSPTDTDDIQLFTANLAAKHLKAAVEQLPSREREVLLLHVNSGLTYWEIAARLGMAEQVVLSDLSRAYSQLRVGLSVEELRR
jgi:RNA polymerase sigma factor (sigma-70 family)